MPSASSIITPLGPSKSTCGYCGPTGGRSAASSSLCTATLDASRLSCQAYQDMIDRGWRRSGTYCYKPDLKHSCCPNYTIKLNVIEFNTSKSQRKLLHRWNRFILGETTEENIAEGKSSAALPNGDKASGKSSPFSLTQLIHASERKSVPVGVATAHNFQIVLEPSNFTPEKFELYRKYQKDIHHDNNSYAAGFERFLVESPLQEAIIPYPQDPPEHLPLTYGSYHQMYRLDGQLIAMGVIDILPTCVSSVYFMYDQAWEKYSLGKLSALREVCLAKEMYDAGAPGMSSLYMGFYIHSCPKMRYKGEYSPSYLADPEDYTWHPLKNCTELLNKYRYACFTNPQRSLEGLPVPTPELAPQLPDHLLLDVLIIDSVRHGTINVIPVVVSKMWKRQSFRNNVYSCVAGLGMDLSNEIVFYSGQI